MNLVPTESKEAHTLVAYLQLHGYRFHHSANETGSSMEARRRAVRVKREGTSKGFPDYLIIRNGHILAIELKRVKSSRTSPEQLEWVDALNQAGVPAYVCKGAQAAIAVIEAQP